MKFFRFTLLILFFSLMGSSMEAQIRLFKKKSSAGKATRDLKKREREADKDPVFNPLQQMGAGSAFQRDDYIWSAGSAATLPAHSGNLSLTSPSRLGLANELELSSWLGLDYWAPNIFIKKNYFHNKWVLASLHGFYSATPGLSYVKGGHGTFLADSVYTLPIVVSMKNQIILSRPFFNSLDCKSNQPYLVLSGAVAVDFGIPLKDGEVIIPNEHFIVPRSPAYTGRDWLLTATVRADWIMTSAIIGHAEIRALHGHFTQSPVFEQQTSVELFLNHHFSGSIGYLLSAGSIGSRTLRVLPFVDLSFYFGQKKDRERGLFKRKMF